MTESLRDVRDKADLAQVEFPDDANAAVVMELSFDDEPIIFFALSGADLYRLREIALAPSSSTPVTAAGPR